MTVTAHTFAGLDPEVGSALVNHIGRTVDAWVRDFRIGDATVHDRIDQVTIADMSGARFVLWGAPRPDTPIVAPADAGDTAVDMVNDPLHVGWQHLAESLHGVSATWLHPDWLWECDPMTIARYGAALPIGCVDRSNPDGPRRYDPTVASWANDVGVINFPLHADYRIPELVEAGIHPAAAASLTVTLAVCEAAAHEACETFQDTPGVPVVDPHRSDRLEITVTATVGDLTRRCDGVFASGS